jgi:two-component system response regulator FimZ (fimbrial Z protein)
MKGTRAPQPVTADTSVLIVDEDAIVGQWLELALRKTEFRLVGQGFGLADGLELVRRRRPRIVLLEWRLTGEVGLELIRTLEAENPGIRVVLMTSRP